MLKNHRTSISRTCRLWPLYRAWISLPEGTAYIYLLRAVWNMGDINRLRNYSEDGCVFLKRSKVVLSLKGRCVIRNLMSECNVIRPGSFLVCCRSFMRSRSYRGAFMSVISCLFLRDNSAAYYRCVFSCYRKTVCFASEK